MGLRDAGGARARTPGRLYSPRDGAPVPPRTPVGRPAWQLRTTASGNPKCRARVSAGPRGRPGARAAAACGHRRGTPTLGARSRGAGSRRLRSGAPRGHGRISTRRPRCDHAGAISGQDRGDMRRRVPMTGIHWRLSDPRGTPRRAKPRGESPRQWRRRLCAQKPGRQVAPPACQDRAVVGRTAVTAVCRHPSSVGPRARRTRGARRGDAGSGRCRRCTSARRRAPPSRQSPRRRPQRRPAARSRETSRA